MIDKSVPNQLSRLDTRAPVKRLQLDIEIRRHDRCLRGSLRVLSAAHTTQTGKIAEAASSPACTTSI